MNIHMLKYFDIKMQLLDFIIQTSIQGYVCPQAIWMAFPAINKFELSKSH